MALCATTALAGAVPCLCVRGARGSGRYLVLCLSRFPLPAPRVPRCVWRAVLSGCPLPSLAGTPFHAVCAFRALSPVALLIVPACSFPVCALALPRCPPPPLLSGVACAPRAVPAGELGCVCACVRAPLVPRHPWLGCAAWVCMLGLGFGLHPANPGWGLGVCVCSCTRSASIPPLLAGVCGVGVCL